MRRSLRRAAFCASFSAFCASLASRLARMVLRAAAAALPDGEAAVEPEPLLPPLCVRDGPDGLAALDDGPAATDLFARGCGAGRAGLASMRPLLMKPLGPNLRQNGHGELVETDNLTIRSIDIA